MNSPDTIQSIKILIDTQADVSIIKSNCLRSLDRINSNDLASITGITKDPILSVGSIVLNFQINGINCTHKCFVMSPEVNIPAPALFGKDFTDFRTIIDSINMKMHVLTTDNHMVTIELERDSPKAQNLVHAINTNPSTVDILSQNFPKEFHNDLNDICDEFANIFVSDNEKLSTNNFYKYEILLEDKKPVFEKNHRLPQVQKTEIARQVEALLKNGQISKSTAPYNSPALLVPKKAINGIAKWRLCIDYKSLNKKIVSDSFPLPRIDDILDNLGNNTYFSVLDLSQGFHQVPLTDNCKDYTTFSTPTGSYKWNVLPFGLKVSPSAFSRMISLAFAEISPHICFIYMDDIIVLGKTKQEHLHNLKTVFQILERVNLKLNPSKCKFFRTQVTYLGHLCSSKGVQPDDAKNDVIKNFPRPASKDAVKQFVAFANYYRKFVKNFAQLAIPLNKLTRKNAEFIWNDECEVSFQSIKQMLLHPKLLKYPDFTKTFTLTVDASKYACGAVLSQMYDGCDHPIAFSSKAFTKGEINKSVIEKELLAIYYAIKHYHTYIFGTHFIVRSDHRPLVYLFSLKDPTSRLTRIRLLLEEYDFSIEYIKGKDNPVADALSRITISELKEINVFIARTFAITRSMTRAQGQGTANVNSNSNDVHLNNQQINNQGHFPNQKPKIVELLNSKMDSKVPRMKCHKINGILTLSVFHKHRLLFQIDMSNPLMDNRIADDINRIGNESFYLQGTLSRLQIEAANRSIESLQLPLNDQIFNYVDLNKFSEECNTHLGRLTIFLLKPTEHVFDDADKYEIIKRFHMDPLVGGHCGQKKLYAQIRSLYYWKNMTKDIAQFVRSCELCKLNKVKPGTKEKMVVTETPQKAFDVVQIDTIGPLIKSHNGNSYVVTIICELTKYVVTIPIPNKQAKTIAKAVFENFILIYGPMRRVLSDRGTEYKNETVEELFKLLNIEYRYSTAFHHQTVGSIERSHRSFNEYIRTYMKKDNPDWEIFLKYFNFCYNISYNATFDFKYTPYELIFSKKCNLPQHFLDGQISPIYNFDNYVRESEFRIKQAWQQAVDLVNKHKIINKKYYDNKVNEIYLNLNDIVYLKVEPYDKHKNVYSGPFMVIDIKQPNVTIINQETNKTQLVHMNRLVKC